MYLIDHGQNGIIKTKTTVSPQQQNILVGIESLSFLWISTIYIGSESYNDHKIQDREKCAVHLIS